MKIFVPAAMLALCVIAVPAAGAQEVPNGNSGPSVQPKPVTPDIAPPALPGAGVPAGIATAPKVAKVNQGDPTTELFTAVNAGDYSSAQDAISRGANLYAQNPLGETPLDLSIALNRNSITFLILGARNEDGPPPAVAAGPMPASRTPADRAMPMAASVESAPPAASPAPVMGNNPGTPNAAAGFLGFGPKN
jgi:hypothetical protein